MPTKGIVYYTDNVPNERFLKIVRTHLKKASGNIPIIWVSQRHIDEFPNIVLTGIDRSHRSMCLQILTGVQNIDADVIYFAEHDVLYHPSHFDFIPPRENCFYYNINRWWLCAETGIASYRNKSSSLSQLVAYRELLKFNYTQRNDLYENGINVRKHGGTEPGKVKTRYLKHFKAKTFSSEWPNVDIRHDRNYTKSNRFKKEDPDYTFSDSIPGWGKTKGRFSAFILERKV